MYKKVHVIVIRYVGYCCNLKPLFIGLQHWTELLDWTKYSYICTSIS